MATFDFQSSSNRDRFVRFNRLLIAGGTPILRDILNQYHTPASLARALHGTKIGFTKPQKLLVSPPSGLPDFEKFDISLIFKLLRNCCGLTEPTTKWNALPVDGDHSLEADIIRIDYYRNDVYGHALEHMALTQQDFDQYWRIISDVLCRRAIYLPALNVTALRNKIDELRFSGLTTDDHRRFEESLRIESMLAEQNKKLDNIEAKEDQIRDGIEGLQDTMISAIQRTNISDDKTTIAAAPSTVQYTKITFNQYGSNYFSEQAPRPQSVVAQGIRRQTSDGTIRHPTPQKSYKKSHSVPSNVGLIRSSWQGSSRLNYVNPFLAPQFQTPQTADQHQQMSDGVWQTSTPSAATSSAPQTGLDHVPFTHQSPACFSQEPSLNPEEFCWRHEWQSPNDTTPASSAPRGGSSKASFMFDQEGLPDRPLADQAAAQSTWTSSSPDIYHATRSDRWPSPVSPSVSRQHEYPKQPGHDPLLRIKISIRGGSLPGGVRLSEVVHSALETADEGSNVTQFTGYLKKHELDIEKIEGNHYGDSCFIGVCPQNLESLEDLWHNFVHQDLKEFIKETVLPEDFEGEVHVDIDGEEYKRCCERLRPRGLRDSGRSLHWQSLSEMGMACSDVQEPFSGSLSRTRSKSVVDLSRPVTDVYQELFRLLCKNGGRMSWQMAIDQLPYSYRSECAKPTFKQNMPRYKLEFIANNVVRAKVSLRFCPKMRKNSTCNNTNCSDLHLCRFHFLPAGCKFPTNCKNSHEISDPHTNTVFRIANLSFLNDDERKRLLRNVAYVAPEICFYYNRNTCTKGTQCPCLHVCEDWVLVNRTCVAGSACRRAHTFMDQHERNIFQKKNLDQLSEREILEKLNEYYS